MTTYLSHHGIRGQKWGVRNGPPYPLGASDHSAAERKAGWEKSLDSKPTSSKSSKSSGGSATSSSKNSVGKSIVSKYSGQKAGSVDPELQQLGIEALVMLGFIAAVKTYQHVSYKNDIKQNSKNNDLSKIPKIKTKHTQDDDMKAINPGFNTGKTKYRMNCTMCSTAYELRRRGYDVEANTTTQGRFSKDVAAWFDIDKKDIHSSRLYDDFYDEIHKEPDGARGQVLLGVGPFDSRHSMVWEKNNGHITIRDCQSGIMYSSMANSIINKNSRTKYEYIRTDNAPINFDKVRDAVVVKGGTNGRK